MSENVENIVLEHLKAIRVGQAQITEDVKDLKFRIGKVEQKMVSLERQMVSINETLVYHSAKFDGLEERLARIEKRLDLVEA